MVSNDKHNPLLQSAWQQAQHLKPKLNDNVIVNRRFFRDEQWYVLQRAGSERLHRINPEAWRIIGQCDGQTSLKKILEHCQSSIDDENSAEALSELELLGLINQLLHEGLITTAQQAPDNMPRRPVSGSSMLSKLRNPFGIRVPLWDPNRFLLNHLRFIKPLFSRPVWYGWLVAMVVGLFLAGMHWEEITHDVVDRIIRPENLLWLWLIYPLTKLFHEFGHAFATRIYGGPVHEVGIMFLFGVPLPYVDASAASAFEQKRHRLLVDAIGIMVELFIAVLALLVWLNVESGLLSQFAYNTMIICSISTLFFNGNPLMRFDGYYLLADALEMPNLAIRSSGYWRYLFKRYLFRLDDERFMPLTTRERSWLFTYGFCAYIYRFILLSGIAYFAAQQYLLLGIVLAIWFFIQLLVNPAVKLLQYLAGSKLGDRKKTAIMKVAMIAVFTVLLFVVVPFPLSRTLSSVVWMPDQAAVRAGTEGFVERIWVKEGEKVVAGEALFTLRDPFLRAERDIARARLAEVQAYYNAALVEDRVQALQIKEDVNSARAELEKVETRFNQLTVYSKTTGNFYLPPQSQIMLNRFVSQGELLAYVIDRQESLIRAIVNQNDIGMVLSNDFLAAQVELRVASWPGEVFTGFVVRAVPTASRMLPSAVLGTAYGGSVVVDPTDDSGMKALEEWFQIDIKLEDSPNQSWLGTRAWVRLELGSEPLALQLYRTLRQLFMKTLSI